MLKWPAVLDLAKSGNPTPDRKVVKTDAEWREQLSDEEYHVTRQAGTERAFSSQMCSLFEPGILRRSHSELGRRQRAWVPSACEYLDDSERWRRPDPG